MSLVPGSARAIQKLKQAGFAVVVNTNQACIGKGYVPESVVLLNNEYMCHLLTRGNGRSRQPARCHLFQQRSRITSGSPRLQMIYPQTKPSPTLLQQGRPPAGSLPEKDGWMIGDRPGDLECAVNGKVRPLLVLTGDGEKTKANIPSGEFKDLVIQKDLPEAARFIINNRKQKK